MKTPPLVHLPSGQTIHAMSLKALAIEQGDLGENYQLGDPGLIELIVGQPKRRRMLGDQLFRRVPVTRINFSHKVYGKERFDVKETKRAMRAKFGHSDRRFDTVAKKLERHGWAAMADRDELNNAAPSLNIMALYAALSREIVELSLEKLRATVALAAASYSASSPDLDFTLAGGSEWNHATNGDSLASIRVAVNALCAQNGVSPDDIVVFLTDASYRAAQEDPKLLTRKANTSLGLADTGTLREYWGVGGVINADAYEVNSAGNGVASMYGDVAILKVVPRAAEFDLSEGELDSFCKFKWMQNAGIPVAPFYKEEYTSWFFPWEDWELAATVSTTAAAIIRNTAA